MSEFADSELSATQTEGYKVGEKKTAEELAKVSCKIRIFFVVFFSLLSEFKFNILPFSHS